MTDSKSSFPEKRYAHLRVNAAAQKQATIDRLTQAIAKLEAEQRPVNTFTIKEVSGMDYMTYYRNPEALALFRTHSTHLREERVKEEAKRPQSKRKRAKQDENLHRVGIEARDPLLNYKKPELAAKLRAAHAECGRLKLRAQDERAEIEQRYAGLLQEHMQCAVTSAKLEAQLAEFQAFMQRFRTALQSEEQGPHSQKCQDVQDRWLESCKRCSMRPVIPTMISTRKNGPSFSPFPPSEAKIASFLEGDALRRAI